MVPRPATSAPQGPSCFEMQILRLHPTPDLLNQRLMWATATCVLTSPSGDRCTLKSENQLQQILKQWFSTWPAHWNHLQAFKSKSPGSTPGQLYQKPFTGGTQARGFLKNLRVFQGAAKVKSHFKGWRN